MTQDSGTVQSILAAVKTRLDAIEVQWRQLDEERRVLMATRDHYINHQVERPLPETERSGTAPSSVEGTLPDMTPFVGLGPTPAVRGFVTLYPGSTPSDVIRALADVIQSNSKGKPKLLSWTIGDLISKQVIEKRDGKLYPVSTAGAVDMD